MYVVLAIPGIARVIIFMVWQVGICQILVDRPIACLLRECD